MAWVETQSCLFLNFGMRSICKVFTTKIELTLHQRLSQVNFRNSFYHRTIDKNVYCKRCISWESISCERDEWEDSATWRDWDLCYQVRVAQRRKLFRKFPIFIDKEVHTSVVVTSVELATEPCRSGMIRKVRTNCYCSIMM